MSNCLYNDTLFEFEVPIQLRKAMSKLTGLHAIFRKISIYGANMGFRALTFTMSLGKSLKPMATDLEVIKGHLISQSHTDAVFRPVALTFLCENQ